MDGMHLNAAQEAAEEMAEAIQDLPPDQEPSPTGQCGSLSVIAGSEFLRFHGERPEKYYAPGAERACGNCKHLKPDYSHPCTDGHSILKQRGWICDCPELGCFSGWTTEGCCEYHERLSFPNDEKLLQIHMT